MPARYPERIVCLTEETTETLYLLGEERRIVGISGYTVRPPRARREQPRVSAILSARIGEILSMIQVLASLVGAPQKGAALVERLETGLREVSEAAKGFASRPRVYFEEWDEPMISGIRWVS